MKLRGKLTNAFLASALTLAGCGAEPPPHAKSPQITESVECRQEDMKGVRGVLVILNAFNGEAESEYKIEKRNGRYTAINSKEPGIKSEHIIKNYHVRGLNSALDIREIKITKGCLMNEATAANWAFMNIHTKYTDLVKNNTPAPLQT